MYAIEELSEEQMRRLVGLAEAASGLRGRGGEPANVATVRDWANKGYRPRGWKGEPAVLRTVIVGRDYLTLPEWIAEFERARLRLGQLARQKPEPPPPARKATAMHRRAAQALDRMAAGVDAP